MTMYPAIFSTIEPSPSPAQALRILFSDPYVHLVPRLFSRTRDFALGLDFVKRCRAILELYTTAIPEKEALQIEYNLTFLELSCLDYLNRWEEYLDLFEKYFREKRTPNYISRYEKNNRVKQTDSERFGRYLLGYDDSGYALVHSFIIIDHRRAVIKRKQLRLYEGKNVEHLKRHQQEQLSLEELDRRYEEMRQIIEWIQESADGG